MYEERERFSFKDVVLQIILVVLFVFLLLWLFPTKSYVDKSLENGLNPLYNQLFSQNVNTMKEAAISYFTTSRLPKKTGDKVSLTLGDMLDKKLLIPFLDSNNKQCNLTESYVEITKMDDEYILKVNLDCSDNSDYILVHLGCYSYCESGLCEKQEKPVQPVTKPSKPVVKPTVTKKYEYEYELVTDGKWGDWSNWSEWSTIKVDKTDYRNVKTKEEVIVTGTETIKVGTTTKVTAAKENSSYYCPNGYTQNGTKCTRPVTTIDTINATVNYSCPSGYTLNGTKCNKTTTSTSTDSKDATANYSCPSGYTLSGTKCNKNTTTTQSINATANYSCPSGYTLSGTKCNKNTTTTQSINATATNTYGCPSGYTLSGNVCSKQVTYVSSYKKGDYIKTVYNASSVPQDTNSYFYEPYGSDYVYDCNNKCAFKWVYTYKVYGAVPVYKTKTETVEKTTKTTYSCPSGYTLNGTKCNKNVITTDTINATVNYSCPSGYTLNGTKCSKNVTTTDTINSTVNYSCPSGYTLNGTKCNKTTTNTSTDSKTATVNYSCPSGYTLNGTKCNKNTITTQSINATTKVTYSCVKGDLVGKSCVTYEDKYETFDTHSTITYYSYQTREFISGDRKTVWSTSQNDKNLIGQGYKLTGNSKEI